MKQLILHITIFLFFLSCSISVNSQITESPEAFKQRVSQLIKNKFRTNPDFLLNYIQEHPEEVAQFLHNKNITKQAIKRTDDNQINDTPDAESELHATINPTNPDNIIVAAMKSDPTDFLAPLTFPIYYTHDFGETWQLSNFDGTNNVEGMLSGGGDPIVIFDVDGTAYLTWLTLEVDFTNLTGILALRFATSTDGGQSWTENPQYIDYGNITDLYTFSADKLVDKEWLVIDDAPQSPHSGNIYVAYTEVNPANYDYNISLRKKLPDADAFTTNSISVNTDNYVLTQFASLDTDAAGVLHVSFAGSLDGSNFALYYTKSEDGGESFSPEIKVSDISLPIFSTEPTPYISGITNQRLYPCPHLRVDNTGGPQDGNIYTVWTANGPSTQVTDGADIYFCKSVDGGSTWETPFIVNSDTDPVTHQFYPALNINPDGKIIVSYYDRRDDPNNENTNYYLTWSDDGGENWALDMAVSTEASDFSQIGSSNGGFGIGEYTQVISTTDFAIPVWSDGRDNNGNIDLYAAFVAFESSAVHLEDFGTISSKFGITGPSPNPVMDEMKISLQLQESSKVAISVYNKAGLLIKEITSQHYEPGHYDFSYKTNALPSGTYILKVHTDFGFKAKQFLVVNKP